MNTLLDYTLHLADNQLILGQRLCEWCGHNFVLEQDIAMSNIALDLIGQARSYYQYAAKLDGKKTEDELAMLRGERDYKNLLLLELPNGDFAETLARQFFYDVFHLLQMEDHLASSDESLRAIAEKAVKEVRYHVTWSSEWMIRLGDGTTESHTRIQKAVNKAWMWTGEMFKASAFEGDLASKKIITDPKQFKLSWDQRVQAILSEATLKLPLEEPYQQGGKEGVHTEHLGFLLAEMQSLQRTYPGLSW
jgi:ring-1,2-phenylacetyl-CoA epoxidase subunit PaaC